MDRQDDTRGIRLTGTEQHEHDTLAELFLGDAPFAPAPMGGSSEANASASSGTPDSAQTNTNTSDAQVGPPIQSRYEGTAIRTMTPGDSSTDDSGRPVVEMVVLGHLPVRASLWVRQYACQSARKRSETVGLLRTAGDSVALDLITGGERAEIEPIDDIRDAIVVARAAANRFVVRVDETAEPELLERAGIDEVTILTGADEAAIVASYRLIKSLVATLENRLDPDASPLLRVAVMGGSGDNIPAACAKIERACLAFLERPIEILDASGRIDASGTTSVCRLDGAGISQEALDALLDRDSVDLETGPMPGLRLADDFDTNTDASTEEPPEVVVMPVAGLTGAGRHAFEVEPKPFAPLKTSEAAVPGVERDSIHGSPGDLVATETRPVAKLGLKLPALIENLVPLETRCPQARGVWFASDDIGALHAVVMDDIDDPVAALVAARAWAMDNLSLLLRAESTLAMPSAEPGDESGVGLHLLTGSPARWRGVFDSEVLVYAVASVTVDSRDHLVATPLND